MQHDGPGRELVEKRHRQPRRIAARVEESVEVLRIRGEQRFVSAGNAERQQSRGGITGAGSGAAGHDEIRRFPRGHAVQINRGNSARSRLDRFDTRLRASSNSYADR